MVETKDPIAQGALAMLSTYKAGVVAFLSGCVTLVTKTWQDPDLPIGISMVAASFNLYFSSFGITIIILSAFLFGFGMILGNSYNGGECFAYLTGNRKKHYYLAGTTLMIFIGSTVEVKTFWYFMDLILACMAIPHMTALLLHVVKKPRLTSARV